MNKFNHSLAVFTVAYSVNALAEGQASADSFFLDDAPVVLSATRLKQSLSDAPAAITVIDKAMIRASGAKEIVELFRLVPGMQVGYKRNQLPSTSYHGMSDEFARGMQVLVDGQSIYLASFGGVYWVDYPLLIEDIERIEVIRGPAAATYGPNAFLGVINIITSHTLQDQGAQANFRAGGGDYYRGAVGYGGKVEDLGYRFSFSHDERNNLENVDNRLDINIFSSRFDYQLSNKDTLQYNFGYSQDKSRLGFDNNLNDPIRSNFSQQFTQNLLWEHQIDFDEQLAVHLTHNRHEIDDDFISDGLAISNDQLSERIDFELQHTFSPFEDTRMVWGLGSRFDRSRLPLWMRDDDKTNVLYRTFANLEWKFLERFSLNFGVLIEKNSYIDFDASPKIALNYQWTDQQAFRLMASRASRMPTLGEQNLDLSHPVSSLLKVKVKTNRILSPVEVFTYEGGYHGRFFNRKLVADIKVAYQRFEQLTQALDVNGSTLDYDTVDVANTLNYEVQLDYKSSQKSLMHVGYSWININHKGGIHNYAKSAPHHSVNLLAAYIFPQNWEASLGYYYRSEMQYLRDSEIGAYQRLDFILRKSMHLTANQKVEVSFVHQANLGSKEEFSPGDRLTDRSFIEVSYQYD